METVEDSGSRDLAVRIRREQIKLLYANLYNGFIATPLCAVIITALMWESVPHVPLAVWLTAMMTVAAARLWSNVRFNKVRGGDFDCRKWERYFMLGTGAAGILWGASMADGFFPDSMPHHVFMLLIVAGLTAGTTMAYSAAWYGPAVFGIPAMVPFVIRFFGYGDPMHYAMGFATLTFIVLNASITKNSNATVIRSLKLMFENTNLVATLQDARKRQAKDYLELEIAKERAETATRLKDEFVAAVSHDLKSPLHSMKGLLDHADKSADGLAELQKKGALSRMSGTAGSLLNMIDHLLGHNRLKSGKIRLEKRFFDAKQLANAHINEVVPATAKKNIALRNELPDDMRIFADPVLFGQVLHNLLTNAVKFTPPGGDIAVFAPRPGKPSIAVRDTGIGIPEDIRGHLFTSDVQTTTLGTDGEKGTGLGLPYSHDIMRAHGGTLEVESGAGSTFTATLPEHRAVILIVDDLAPHRDLMKEMLRVIGHFEIVEAENGKEAVEHLRNITPDLVITDLMMPEMDGYALMEHIRASVEIRWLPIIAVSSNAANGYKEMRDTVIMAGGDELLAKPLEERSFIKAARGFIGIN